MEARSVGERRVGALAGSQLHGCMAETPQAWKHRNQVNGLKLLFYSEQILKYHASEKPGFCTLFSPKCGHKCLYIGRLTILDCQETSLALNIFPLRIREHNVFPELIIEVAEE